jgi:cytochrome bd ubiquinol oxidase subunit II
VPINADKMFTGNLFTLLNPYALLGGLTTASIFLLHGANFLSLKLEGELRERVNSFAKKIWMGVSILYVVLSAFTYSAGFWARGIVNPGSVPIAAIAALLVTGYFINRKMEVWAFIMVGMNIILTQVVFFSMTFPNVMISTTNPQWSLTIYNASSSQYTLGVMSVLALIFLPIVLVYQGWSYYMFRKRISTDKNTLVY